MESIKNILKNIFTNRWLYYIAGGFIAFALLMGVMLNFVIMPQYTNFNKGVTVPDVTKLSLTEAENLLEQYGLRHEVLERRANAVYPANYIIDQAPSPLQIVKPHRKVYLTVNTKVRPTAVVPDVVDMSLTNARIQIENYGFTVGTTTYETARFRNTVLQQSLAPGDTVRRGEVINLTVSDGLGGRTVDVPDIVGNSLTEAQQKIRRAGLQVEDIRYEASREVTPNTVLSFSPDVDQLTEGQSLRLIVSERFDAREETESGAVGADTTISAPPDSTINDNDQQ
ncbi:hypothetical protein BH23BAC3_BH23BAC3_10660 [soil metagenome]